MALVVGLTKNNNNNIIILYHYCIKISIKKWMKYHFHKSSWKVTGTA